MSSNIVSTSRQEREWGGGSSKWYRGLKANQSRTSLWKLKQEKPDLFSKEDLDQIERNRVETMPPPMGFRPTVEQGWFYHPDRHVYWEAATGRRCWLDETSGEKKDLHEGDVYGVVFAGGATFSMGQTTGTSLSSRAGKSSSGSASAVAAAALKQRPAPKHVLVPDMHRAAESLRIDLAHLDRPSSLLAVFAPLGLATPEAAARSLHERLLRRLGAFRGEWTDEALCAALSGAITEVSRPSAGAQIAVAAGLAVGNRFAAAATSSARFLLVRGQEAVGAAPHEDAVAACLELQEAGQEVAEQLNVVLLAGQLSAADAVAEAAASAAKPAVALCRSRAVSLALLQAARPQGDESCLVAAVGFLTGATERSTVEPALGGPAKRQRTGDVKVRVRQILLRHSSGSSKTVDPVRRKPVSRSLEEAESEMLGLLQRIEKETSNIFPSLCRSTSECQSALKGGDMAGDLGWLDQAMLTSQDKAKTVRPELPAQVLRVALELSIGQVSDIVSSDIGVHLLQRTA